MLVKKEKYYAKQVNKTTLFGCGYQYRKRTSFLLFGFIPVYIKDEVIDGKYEI